MPIEFPSYRNWLVDRWSVRRWSIDRRSVDCELDGHLLVDSGRSTTASFAIGQMITRQLVNG